MTPCEHLVEIVQYKVAQTLKNGDHLVSIIPVNNIRHSIHLVPKFGPIAPVDWKSHNVLDKCAAFFANPWTDHHIYATLYLYMVYSFGMNSSDGFGPVYSHLVGLQNLRLKSPKVWPNLFKKYRRF